MRKFGLILRYLGAFLALHLLFFGFTGVALWGPNVEEFRGLILTLIHAVVLFGALISVAEDK